MPPVFFQGTCCQYSMVAAMNSLARVEAEAKEVTGRSQDVLGQLVGAGQARCLRLMMIWAGELPGYRRKARLEVIRGPDKGKDVPEIPPTCACSIALGCRNRLTREASCLDFRPPSPAEAGLRAVCRMLIAQPQ